MIHSRGSSRLRDVKKLHIVDQETRDKRQKRQLAALEKDNFQDDPHYQMNLYVAKAKLPSFDNIVETKKKRKARPGDIFKHKAKRSFQALIEELNTEVKDNQPSYLKAVARPSQFPGRKFCSVCGFISDYTCISCGIRYCSVSCLKTHQDTRCMKWTA